MERSLTNGFSLGLTICFLLLLGARSAHSHDVMPAQWDELLVTASSEASSLSYRTKADNPDYRYIEDELTMTGVLLAYWDVRYLDMEPVTLVEADTIETLYLRFYPDADNAPLLTSLAEAVGEEEVNRIFLYRSLVQAPGFYRIETEGYGTEESAAVEEALKVFDHVPAEFMEYHEGYVVQPVSITLVDVISFVELNHRFTYARAKAVEPLNGMEIDLGDLPDFQLNTFLGQPWRQDFYVSEPVALRASPQPDGEAIGQLTPEALFIEKLQTLADGWVRVRLTTEEGTSLLGYVQASHLWIVN